MSMRFLVSAALLCLGTAALAQTERPWVDPPRPQQERPPDAASPPAPAGAAPTRPEAAPKTEARPAEPVRRQPAPISEPSKSSKLSASRSRRGIATRKAVEPSPGAIVTSAPVAQEAPARKARVREASRPAFERAPVAPSFNCRYARTPVERAICADPLLASKDRRMALMYEQAGGSRHRPVDPAQWRWLAARERCARAGSALEQCVNRVYDARIAELAGR